MDGDSSDIVHRGGNLQKSVASCLRQICEAQTEDARMKWGLWPEETCSSCVHGSVHDSVHNSAVFGRACGTQRDHNNPAHLRV